MFPDGIRYMEKFGISKSKLPQIVAVDYERDRFFFAEGYAVRAWWWCCTSLCCSVL